MQGPGERLNATENMSCTEFQRVLPEIIARDEDVLMHPHLQSCHNCSDLVRDLLYIAEQAKLLLPMRDPGPRVWNNIEDSLRQEGLLKEGRLPGLGQTSTFPQTPRRWPALGWAAGLAAVLLLAIGLFTFNRTNDNIQSQQAALGSAPEVRDIDADDSALLAEIGRRSPNMRKVYESNLRNVNTSIADAKSVLQEDPTDADARGMLREAYAQKAMLYDMAMARSTE